MSSRGVVPRVIRALPFASLSLGALAGAQSPVDMAAALKECATIRGPTERLACYDQLAARTAPPTVTPSAVTPSAITPSAPVGTGASPAAQQAPVATSKESFGLYAAEHPKAPKSDSSHTAKILELGMSSSGRPTVALEGGELWELDAADPLLAEGNSVIIKRAALGSFLMTTPSGRTHRVHRLH
jgi:hypothetical protein